MSEDAFFSDDTAVEKLRSMVASPLLARGVAVVAITLGTRLILQVMTSVMVVTVCASLRGGWGLRVRYRRRESAGFDRRIGACARCMWMAGPQRASTSVTSRRHRKRERCR